MRIESGLAGGTQEAQLRESAGAAVSRQVQNTSKSEDGLSQKPQATRFEIKKGVGVEPSKTTVQKPIDVEEAIEKLNKYVQSQKKYVNFSVDEKTHSTVIRFFKTETGELIKQFPPEEILAMAAKIRESIGWIVDNKA